MFSFPLHVLLLSTQKATHDAVQRELAPSPARLSWKPTRQSVSRREKPEAILLETDDLGEISRLRTLLAGVPVIVLQSEVDYQWGLAAIREGASDCISLSEIGSGNLFRLLRFWVERWKVERALQQSDAQLIAVQRMEGLGRTVAGVAHDFRHFLQVVYGNCNLMKRLNENPSIDEMIDEIKLAAEKANQLIKQMLDFAQGAPANRTTFDINESLTALGPLYRKLLRPGVETKCDLADESLLVSLDSRFEQVVMNLIANACDAVSEHRGTILVETRALALERDYLDQSLVLPHGAYVVMSISDNGHGIEAHDIARIFEPFFTTKGRDVGTGLGLSVVFALLQEWKGYVTVGSVPGKGTTFNLIFPRQCAPEPEEPMPRLSLALALRETNEALQLVLRRDLTALGCEARLLDSAGPTLVLDSADEERGLQVCQLSPGLMTHLGLLPPGTLALATPFTRRELASALSTLAQSRTKS
jgi:signal transduction histidine kinase